MYRKYLALCAAATVSAAFPQMKVKENGVDKTMYIAHHMDASMAPKTKNSLLTMPHNARAYMTTSDKLGPDNFYQPNLLDGSLEYDIDLSQAGCSCNVVVYLLHMPGIDKDGNIWPTSGNDYYCDAKGVGGEMCPDHDVMEANKWAFQATPHTCEDPDGNGHFSKCDGFTDPCAQKAQATGHYGPGNKVIDTNKPFHVKVDFTEDAFVTTLSQAGRTLPLTSDCKSYFPRMAKYIKSGLTVTFSNWGDKYDTMKWLDQDTPCKADCTNDPTLYISNMKITTGKSDAEKNDFDWYGDLRKWLKGWSAASLDSVQGKKSGTRVSGHIYNTAVSKIDNYYATQSAWIHHNSETPLVDMEELNEWREQAYDLLNSSKIGPDGRRQMAIFQAEREALKAQQDSASAEHRAENQAELDELKHRHVSGHCWNLADFYEGVLVHSHFNGIGSLYDHYIITNADKELTDQVAKCNSLDAKTELTQ